MLFSHLCQIFLKIEDTEVMIGRIQAISLKTETSDNRWLAQAIQYDPEKRQNRLLEFNIEDILFTKDEQKIYVSMSTETPELPYGFCWYNGRMIVDSKTRI